MTHLPALLLAFAWTIAVLTEPVGPASAGLVTLTLLLCWREIRALRRERPGGGR